MSTHLKKSATWFARLGRALGGNHRGGTAQNRRRLRFESLEARSLLSATVAPSISGVVYENATGAASAQTPLGNITVNLWRDGGDGVFEGSSGGSDDTLVGTTTTNSAGAYSFSNLSTGTYFVQQAPVPGLVMTAGQGVQTVVVTSADMLGTTGAMIDSFASTSQYVSGSLHGGKIGMSSEPTTDAIGGNRNLYVQLTTAGGSVDLGADADWPGMLDFGADAASNGIFWVNWDGHNSNPAVLNPTGLGQADLTAQGTATGIELNVGADHDNGYIMLKVYSNAADWSFASVPITDTGDGSLNTSDSQYVPFSSFMAGGGTGANFSQVGAVQLSINGVNAIDGEIGPIETVGPTVFTENFVNAAEADLSVLKTASPSTAIAGDQLTYTFTTTNNGPSNATDVTLSDTLPAGVQYVSASSSQGTVADNSGTISVQLGSLASGGVATTSVVVIVAPSDTGSLTNTVMVTGDQPDPNLNNNTSTITTPIAQSVDLALVKSATPNPVEAGQQLTYTVTATNNGPSNATGVTIVDTLPPVTSYVSSSGPATAMVSGQTLTLNVGSLSAGASATETIVVTVASTASGTITNTATVSGNQPDPNLANNTASVTTTIDVPVVEQSFVDVKVVKSASVNPVVVGNDLTYTIGVSNNSLNTAGDVMLVDTLPAGYTYISSTGPVTPMISGSTLTWDLGAMTAEAADTITILGQVTSAAASTITNTATATVSGDNPEENQADLTASVTTTVLRSAAPSKYYLLGRH